VEGKSESRDELRVRTEKRLDVMVGLASLESSPTNDLHTRGLEALPAESRNHALDDDLGEVLGAREGERVLQILLDGAPNFPKLHQGSFASQDLDHPGLDAEASRRLGKAIVVSEDDDLTAFRELVEDSGEAVDARRVHGLHGVIDDEEAERAGFDRGSRQEERECQGVELALAHDSERGSLGSVHGNVEAHVSGGRLALEGDVLELDVASGSQEFPDSSHLLFDGEETLVSNRGRGRANPILRGFQMADDVGLGEHFLRFGKPGGEREGDRAP
jgi:hypothetical protein